MPSAESCEDWLNSILRVLEDIPGSVKIKHLHCLDKGPPRDGLGSVERAFILDLSLPLSQPLRCWNFPFPILES